MWNAADLPAHGREGRARHRRHLRARPRRRRGLRTASVPPCGCSPAARSAVSVRARRSSHGPATATFGSGSATSVTSKPCGASPSASASRRARLDVLVNNAGALLGERTLSRRRHRADLRDQRARTLPADEPAHPAAREERARAHRQRVLGRHVHAADPRRGPAERRTGISTAPPPTPAPSAPR